MAEDICEIVGEVQKSARAVDDDGGLFIRVQVLRYFSSPMPWKANYNGEWRKSMGEVQV